MSVMKQWIPWPVLGAGILVELAFAPPCIPGPQPESEVVDTPVFDTPELNPPVVWKEGK